jgi:PncC family amidohydrolase
MAMPEPDSDLIPALATAERLGRALEARGLSLATAESCTGGLIGAWITAVAGSSAWYLGGVVAYANAAKVAMLGLPPEILARFGAVSPETACGMAEGARLRLGADLGVSVTGIAGPGGGSPEKPVGTVYIGLASRDGVASQGFCFEGDRAAVRRAAAREALLMVLRGVEG